MLNRFQELLNSEKEDELNYINMSADGLITLSDDDSYSAVEYRVENKVEKYDEITDGIKALSDAEKNFYICQYYEMEVDNGGLCQFFVNSSRNATPYLSDCLEAIGAADHKKLFDSFIHDNMIDLNDLSSFIIYKDKDYYKLLEKYPFDCFDDSFYELEPLEDKLVDYVRKNINSFR